jgi:hypothetical protein
LRTTRLLPIAAALVALAPAAHAAPRFAAPFLAYPTGFDGRAVAIADVNLDAHPDVLIGNQTGLEVRLGAGDGTLGAANVFPAGTARFLAVGDLDEDGVPDVVTSADSLHVGVLRGHGDGTFAPLVSFPVAKGPADAALVDLDGDGDLDLLCTGSQANAVTVLLGDGHGGFVSRFDYATGGDPGALAVGDLNHDGAADVVVGNRQSSSLTRLLGDGAGGLGSSLTVTLTSAPGDLVLADLDGDSWLDAVSTPVSELQLMIAPGTPGGGFAAALGRPLPGISTAVAAADVDDDGTLDVLALDYYTNRGLVLRGIGGFLFEPPRYFNAARSPFRLAVGDLNGGGKLDVVSVSLYGSTCVHMGNGDATFGGVNDQGMGIWTWGVACADLDEDGHADIATTNVGSHDVVIRFGAGGGSFSDTLSLPCAIEPHGITIADLDLDGHRDLVVAQHGPGTQTESSVSVFHGDGARGFGPRLQTTVGRWAEQVAVGDWNGDGYPDLAVACNDAPNTLTLLDGHPGRTFIHRQDFALGSNATSVAIADVTRDGRADVLLTAYYTGQVIVLQQLATGEFGAPVSLNLPGAVSVGAGDLTGDGFPDVVASGSFGLSLFPSTPLGGFADRQDHAGGSGPLLLADLDLNGRLDVVTANSWPGNSVAVWFGLGGGGLGPAEGYGAGDRTFGVATADVNDDDLLDLITANLEGHSSSLLFNTGGMAWLPWVGTPREPLPTSLALRARPNPIVGRGSFDYALPRPAVVQLRVLDVSGRMVARFEPGEQPAGRYILRWETGGLRAGVYFAELRAGNERLVQQVVLLP